jgi:hypothetical protein
MTRIRIIKYFLSRYIQIIINYYTYFIRVQEWIRIIKIAVKAETKRKKIKIKRKRRSTMIESEARAIKRKSTHKNKDNMMMGMRKKDKDSINLEKIEIDQLISKERNIVKKIS